MSKRTQGDNDSRRYYDWLNRAGEDVTSAQLLLANDSCYNNAAFHCQQAIEKALKAYILLRSRRLVDGHNLTWLCRQAIKHNSSFQKWLDESASLNKLYIETRYPADFPFVLELRDVQRYCEMAEEMYAFICQEIDAIVV